MIRGEKRALNRKMPHIHKEVKFSIHNRFDIEVVDAVTGEVKQKAYAENIVLDALWTRLLAPNTYFNYIHYGMGTGTPSASRTSLFTFLGAKAVSNDSVIINQNSSEGWVSFRKLCLLSESEYVGSELKEVGIGYGSASGSLVTHALLKDMNGNTITVIKSSTDIINIYATVFIHWNPSGYDNGSIKIFGNKIIPTRAANHWSLIYFLCGCDVASIPTNINFCKGDPNRAGPSLSSLVITKTLIWSYNVSLKKMIASTIRLAAGEANTSTGIKGISLGKPDQYFQAISLPAMLFDVNGTWFDKSVITGESISSGDGNTTDFSTVFPFVKEGATVYVDGVAQTAGVTIRTDKPNAQVIDAYLKVLEVYLPPSKGTGSYELVPYPGRNWNTPSDASVGGVYCICENPFYTDGITSYTASNIIVYVSDDLITWTQISDSDHYERVISVPTEHSSKRYWKMVTKNYYAGNIRFCNILCPTYNNYKNIHFDTPPATGSIITADYDCEVIAKDANHVFDFSFEITLAEKTS